MPAQHITYPVSERALCARINRRLSREDASRLLRSREDSRSHIEFGRYYLVDRNNVLSEWHVDIEELGRSLGVLRADEGLQPA